MSDVAIVLGTLALYFGRGLHLKSNANDGGLEVKVTEQQPPGPVPPLSSAPRPKPPPPNAPPKKKATRDKKQKRR